MNFLALAKGKTIRTATLDLALHQHCLGAKDTNHDHLEIDEYLHKIGQQCLVPQQPINDLVVARGREGRERSMHAEQHLSTDRAVTNPGHPARLALPDITFIEDSFLTQCSPWTASPPMRNHREE